MGFCQVGWWMGLSGRLMMSSGRCLRRGWSWCILGLLGRYWRMGIRLGCLRGLRLSEQRGVSRLYPVDNLLCPLKTKPHIVCREQGVGALRANEGGIFTIKLFMRRFPERENVNLKTLPHIGIEAAERVSLIEGPSANTAIVW